MAINPAGFVKPFDFGVPHVITALAADVVSGGQICYLSSGTSAAVNSGLASFAAGDILVNVPASGINYPIGIVTQNAGSNTYCSILVEGFVHLPAGTGVTAGNKVAVITGAHAVDVYTSGTATTSLLQHQSFGRAMTSAASGAFVLVHVRGL